MKQESRGGGGLFLSYFIGDISPTAVGSTYLIMYKQYSNLNLVWPFWRLSFFFFSILFFHTYFSICFLWLVVFFWQIPSFLNESAIQIVKIFWRISDWMKRTDFPCVVPSFQEAKSSDLPSKYTHTHTHKIIKIWLSLSNNFLVLPNMYGWP